VNVGNLIAFIGVVVPLVLAALSRLPAFSRDGRARHAVMLDIDLLDRLPDGEARTALAASIAKRVTMMVERRERSAPPEVLLTAAWCLYVAGAVAAMWLSYRDSSQLAGRGGEVFAAVVAVIGIGGAIGTVVLWLVVRVALLVTARIRARRTVDRLDVMATAPDATEVVATA